MTEVVTQGTGRATARADQAMLRVTFSSTARTRAEAVALLGERVDGVEPLLDRAGVVVRSRRLGVHADWQRQRQVGCRAEQHYNLEVTDPEVLADLAGVLLAAEPERLDGPTWSLRDDTAARNAAQRAAVDDARSKAVGYADALGRSLGPLLRISDAEASGSAARGAYGGAEAAGIAPAGRSTAADVRRLNLEPQDIVSTVRCVTHWTLTD
ncbi:hypothetical protein FHR81_003782 [Actinoalloteichus hoggarensis]|uniref:Oxidative stress defense protein n=1 Tax=Actinoalloteichus hoggarensis TaxID=1470176 RepID=A0A221WCA2_9PSEU|nr:SIMPL domain-containing protein [Actinoalloteichus hoggarensis]ASO23119.1 oxidative stress defense protein [Actinoalloteichus hoggarensis]MBB5922725.1 hypothetical protein [Actinoalloteichus hoggarensis]